MKKITINLMLIGGKKNNLKNQNNIGGGIDIYEIFCYFNIILYSLLSFHNNRCN